MPEGNPPPVTFRRAVSHSPMLSISVNYFRVSKDGKRRSPGQSREDRNKQKQSNLQRIQQRKQAVREWPADKKLEKLAIYSSCKADACSKCNQWKNPNPLSTLIFGRFFLKFSIPGRTIESMIHMESIYMKISHF